MSSQSAFSMRSLGFSVAGLIALGGLISCGGVDVPKVLDTKTPPVIGSFTATPATVPLGQSVVLNWSVTGATSLSLNPGGITVTGATTRTVTPTETTTYRLTATGPGGTVFRDVPVTVESPRDQQAPSVPAQLVATAVSSVEVNLTWSASTDNVGVTGYRVFRNGAQVGTPTASTFQDVGLTPNTSYTYTVAAVDGAENVSAQSSPASTTTKAAGTVDTEPPSEPTGLTIGAVTASSVTLSWSPSTDNVGVAGYRVFRDNNQVGAPTSTSFQDGGLTPNQTYRYEVLAVDGAGHQSSRCAPVNVTTTSTSTQDREPPSAPTGLKVSAVTDTSLTLSWTASTDNTGVTGYRILCNGTQVGTNSTTTFNSKGLKGGTTYTFVVVAVDQAGNASAESSPIVVTTQVGFSALCWDDSDRPFEILP